MPWLEWLDRAAQARSAGQAPYRLLQPSAKLDHGDPDAPNLLIQGDNLDALKALLPYYAGQAKCVFIDPPYNTGAAFQHYDDNVEHSLWLSLIYPRLELLRDLLCQDGSLWVTLDDNEVHYFKVIADEIFGRKNFVADIFWQKTPTRENRTDISAVHDHVLVYAKNRETWKDVRNMLPASESQIERFKNPDGDPRGVWSSLPAHAKAEIGRRKEQFFTVTTPSGRKVDPPPGRCWLYTTERFKEMVADNRIWFGEDGANVPRVKKFLTEVQAGLVPSTMWTYQEVGTNGAAKAEILKLFPGQTPFSTPKPEALIQRIIEIATNPGDLVIDSFLGSGTTAAVAHKLNRRWIGIEMGEHAISHCQPRLRQVVDGEQGGISKAVGWKGGSGFHFYTLGPPVFDENGHINEAIRFEHLAAHVWFAETGAARSTRAKKSPLLGVHAGTAYYLLYNGILGDKRPDGGNVLTLRVLTELPPFEGRRVIYGEATRLSPERLASLGVVFKQTPYDLKAR